MARNQIYAEYALQYFAAYIAIHMKHIGVKRTKGNKLRIVFCRYLNGLLLFYFTSIRSCFVFGVICNGKWHI